jgi:hypothetical protein
MKTGIGILDIYDDDSLKNCLDNIPENYYVCVISNRQTSYKDKKINNYIRVNDVSLAHMRNLILYDFRINELDYYFILHSDQVIENSNIFEKIQKTAETFGTWFLSGYINDKTLDIEDDKNHETVLKISNNLNSKFLYTFKGIIKTFGFFDEQFVNSHDLDVYDYITRLRNKKMYTPNGFYPTISIKMLENKKTIKNPYIKDFPSEDNSVRYSYGYFMNKNKFIPNHNENKEASQQDVLESIEFLQENYAKK